MWLKEIKHLFKLFYKVLYYIKFNQNVFLFIKFFNLN